MAIITFDDFITVTKKVIGPIDTITQDADPNPWFSKDIYRKKDIQWAGYLGPTLNENKAYAFGLNLEFTTSWKKLFPRLKRDLNYFSDLLLNIPRYEWHWWGRPAFLQKNPKIKYLSNPMLTNQVDLKLWISELDDILEKRKKWPPKEQAPMRPQIQIVQQVALNNQVFELDSLSKRIQQIVNELTPIAKFLGNK